MLRAWFIVIVFFGGIFALCWYGATGETGPMGWLNSWQAGSSGSYSRALSFTIVSVAAAIIATPVLALLNVVAKKFPARPGATPMPLFFPSEDRIAAAKAAEAARAARGEQPGVPWRPGLKIWLVGAVLVWGGVLGWHGWDFHRRAADAAGVYTPLHLARATSVTRPEDGSHLALQGRLLWDRSVTRTSKDGAIETETMFVPVAGSDWQPGDAVQFVAQFDRSQAWDLQHRAGGIDGTLLVRVDGDLPTPSRAVFQRAEAPPADAAVLVDLVASDAGQVSDAHPTFDWDETKRVGLAVSATWSAGMALGGLGLLVKGWKRRRGQAKRIA